MDYNEFKTAYSSVLPLKKAATRKLERVCLPAGITEIRIDPNRENIIECWPSWVEVGLRAAFVLLKTYRGGLKPGVDFIFNHERSHQLFWGYKVEGVSRNYSRDLSRKVQERIATLYAFSKSKNPIEDYSSSLAITSFLSNDKSISSDEYIDKIITRHGVRDFIKEDSINKIRDATIRKIDRIEQLLKE